MSDKSSLNSARALALLPIYDSDGFKAVIDIMEDECNNSENEFLGTSPADKEQVLATHAILHAQRKFLQSVITRIDNAVAAARGTKVPVRKSDGLSQILSVMPELEE